VSDNWTGGTILVVFRLHDPDTTQLLDQGRLTMNPKLLLKVFPVALLMVVQVVGMGGVVRSEGAIPGRRVSPQVEAVKESIPELIKLLKDADVRSSAARALGYMGNSAKAAIPDLIPLLKDENSPFAQSTAVKRYYSPYCYPDFSNKSV
jgi:hypothetical protein